MMRFNLSIGRMVFVSLLVLMVKSVSADQWSVSLKAEQWDMPRHGEALIKQPELGKIVHYWKDHPEQIIEIRYPGGEEGEVWVRELMDWLVALGIPSSAMVHVPGSGAEDLINLVLIQGIKKNE